MRDLISISRVSTHPSRLCSAHTHELGSDVTQLEDVNQHAEIAMKNGSSRGDNIGLERRTACFG